MCACSVSQSCPTLCNLMVCSPTSSSVYGIFQASILEWVAISSSRVSSRPMDQSWFSWVSFFGRQNLYHWATWEAHLVVKKLLRLQWFRPLGFSSPIWPMMIKYWPQTPSVLISSVFPTLSWYQLVILFLGWNIKFIFGHRGFFLSFTFNLKFSLLSVYFILKFLCVWSSMDNLY